jgi:hypothetical protein
MKNDYKIYFYPKIFKKNYLYNNLKKIKIVRSHRKNIKALIGTPSAI